MSINDLKAALPDYAKDIKLNLGGVLDAPGMSDRQVWGTALAAAMATGNGQVIAAIESEAASRLDDAEIKAAKTAAALMAMNNIYYRFTHLAGTKDYASMPARLRMNAIANPGVDKADFELWSLAVSAINGCGMCIDAHDRELIKAGTPLETIQNAVRIASVIHAVAVTLNGERAAVEHRQAA